MSTNYRSNTTLLGVEQNLDVAIVEVNKAATESEAWYSVNADRYRETLKDLEAGIRAIEVESSDIRFGITCVLESLPR